MSPLTTLYTKTFLSVAFLPSGPISGRTENLWREIFRSITTVVECKKQQFVNFPTPFVVMITGMATDVMLPTSDTTDDRNTKNIMSNV